MTRFAPPIGLTRTTPTYGCPCCSGTAVPKGNTKHLLVCLNCGATIQRDKALDRDMIQGLGAFIGDTDESNL